MTKWHPLDGRSCLFGDVALPPCQEMPTGVLRPGLFDLDGNLPVHHVVIGGMMVHLHGAAVGRHSQPPTRDVDVLLDVGVMPRKIATCLSSS